MAGAAPSPAEADIRERIHRLGPIPFHQFMDVALYGPGGFFTTGGGAGRGRDFLTSPEVGPLFGAVLARALDAWWRELGEPDPFVVVEAGAGRGVLARDVIAAAPTCAPALHYVLVEQSERLRAEHSALLRLEPPSWSASPAGTGPVVTSLAALPAGPIVGVVIANELLDNLVFDLLERTTGEWCEVRVAEVDGRLVEMLVPAGDAIGAECERLVPDAAVGARIPIQHAASAWLRDALTLVERGRVCAVDYAAETRRLAQRPPHEWLRTFRGHSRGGHPLDRPGSQDITVEVAIDQLARVRPPTSDRTQAEFLRAHGVDALADEARAVWHAGSARP